jgi:acetyl-CoA carboxylase biotin carboxyl carrier protein
MRPALKRVAPPGKGPQAKGLHPSQPKGLRNAAAKSLEASKLQKDSPTNSLGSKKTEALKLETVILEAGRASGAKALGTKNLGTKNSTPKDAAKKPSARDVAAKNATARNPAVADLGAKNLGGKDDNSEGSIDPAVVRQIAELLNATDLTEIEVQKGDLRIRVARTAQVTAPAVPTAPPTAVVTPAAAEAAASDHPGMIKSPMVGTAYRRPSPEAKAFVEIGSQVKAGEKILLIEAMKTFNEILAPRAGTVTAILVEDNQPVEYDQPLMIIE